MVDEGLLASLLLRQKNKEKGLGSQYLLQGLNDLHRPCLLKFLHLLVAPSSTISLAYECGVCFGVYL